MSLIDDVNEAIATSGDRSRCTVCEELARLRLDEAVSLEALNSKLGAKRLSVIMQKHGIAVGVPSIHLHRREGH